MQEEQREIYQSNDNGKRGLTWAQTKNMPVTFKVFQEVTFS